MSKAKEAVEAIEQTLDILDQEALSWSSKIAQKLNTPTVKLSVIGVVMVAATATATYFLTAKKLEAKYQKIADEQVADVKNHYTTIHKTDLDLEELASKYDADDVVEVDEIIKSAGYLPYDKVASTVDDSEEADLPASKDDIAAELERRAIEAEEEAEAERAAEEHVIQVTNIFDSVDPETYFDYEEELAKRALTPEKPYVITKDEFNENETDYNQTTLTFFDGDQVLTDEKDTAINDEDSLVGSENLLRFGHGSEDKNIVYVRNERLELDIEILRSDGNFTEEVLGYIKHSDSPGIRRFRNHD